MNGARFGRGIGAASFLLPDIIDPARREIGEIKPFSPTGIAAGVVQLEVYLTVANGIRWNYKGVPYQIPPFLGGGWHPSTWPVGIRALPVGDVNPAYANWVIFTIGNAGGLILYRPFQVPRTAIRLVLQFAAAQTLAETIAAILASKVLTIADEYAIEQLLWGVILVGVLVPATYKLAGVVAAYGNTELGSRTSLSESLATIGGT